MNYYDRSGTLLMAAAFDGLIGKTQFPCYLLLPQNITESVLDQKLRDAGIPLYRPYKAVDMRENPKDGNTVDVSFENGQSITAQYVIGADGAQSVVSAIILVGHGS
jgi:2-polyprenyl-6-methoxyphenol hydroxylase-like FAD-dependent oxidoreductase